MRILEQLWVWIGFIILIAIAFSFFTLAIKEKDEDLSSCIIASAITLVCVLSAITIPFIYYSPASSLMVITQ